MPAVQITNQDNQPALIFEAIVLKVVFNFVPSVVAPVINATPIKAAISPYSIAVAPDSSLMKRAKIFNIVFTLLGLTSSVNCSR